MDLATVTLAALLACLTAGTLILIASGIFELRQAAKVSDYKHRPNRRLYRRRPMIEVVLPANDPLLLYECLLSLAAGRYRKFQITLVGRQQAEVKSLVAKFKGSYPSIRIQTLSKQSFSRRSGRCQVELRLLLSKPMVLDEGSLKAAAMLFATDSSLQALRPEILAYNDYSFGGLMARFGGLLRTPARKTAELLGLYNNAPQALICRADKGKDTKTSRGLRAEYNTGVVFYTISQTLAPESSITSYIKPAAAPRNRSLTTLLTALLTAVKLCVVVLSLLLAGYAVYLALWKITAVPLFLLWAGLALYLCLSAIQSEYFSLLTKLRLIILAPVLCVPFYIWSILVSAISLRNLRRY
jgi:hypothetical protein